MKKKGFLSILTAFVLMSSLTACSIGGREVVLTTGIDSQDVFKIGEVSGTLPEARVYLANYQNIYGKSYGIDLWEQKFQNRKLETYVKDVTLAEMTRIVCMELLAKDQNISLTEDEIADVKSAADSYYNSLTEAEKNYMQATITDIEKMYEEYALAHKVYRLLTEGVDAEVSDDEARIMEAMQIYVVDEKRANEVQTKLSSGEDFAAVASNYNQKPVIEITFGRGEMPKEVEQAAFELDNEEISDCIKTDEGYYFIQCTNKFNEELTDANKSNIVEAREKAAFDDVYEEFVSGLSSNMNQELWDSVELVTDGSITTSSYFTTIEEVINKNE